MSATCHCGARLHVEDVGADGHASQYRCHCPRCHKRASAGDGDGFVIDVDGFGPTPEAAIADRGARVDTF
jgi:hypothetical protein